MLDWQVLRNESFTYTRAIRSRHGRQIGEETVTDPPHTVVGEHNAKATAEKHRDKCNRTHKPYSFTIRHKQGNPPRA